MPKSLLFENFNVNDLASYFVDKHEPTLAGKFAERLQGQNVVIQTGERQRTPAAEGTRPVASGAVAKAEATPLRLLEKNAFDGLSSEKGKFRAFLQVFASEQSESHTRDGR